MATLPVVRIADLELFADCSKAELRQIASLTTYLQVQKDQVLMREGARANEFVIIGSGTAQVWRQTNQGAVTVAEVGSGDFLGEMGLLAGTSRTATVTATSDLTVLVSSASEFRSILHIAPSVANKVVQASNVRAASLNVAA
jgi:CRP-like cAMP-binding protein